ncbi:MAG: O-antigen ligase family protein [Candidatus Brocadiia bacterium]
MNKLVWILCAFCLLAAPAPPLLGLAGALLLVVTVVAAVARPRDLRWEPIAVVTVVNMAYWGLNALLVAERSLGGVFSWSFVRWQGRGVLCYVPLLCLALRGRRFSLSLKRLLNVYVLVFALVAAAGAAQLALGIHPELPNDLQPTAWPVRYMHGGVWFFGLHRSHSAAGAAFGSAALAAWLLLLLRPARKWKWLLPCFALIAWALLFTKSRTYVCAFLFAAFVAWVGVVAARRRAVVGKAGRGVAFVLTLLVCLALVPGGYSRYASMVGLPAKFSAHPARPDGGQTPEPAEPAPATQPPAGQPPQEEPQMEEVTALNRKTYWRAGLKMAAARPLLGVGLGRYGQVFYELGFRTPWKPRLAMMHAHNSFVHYMAELGLLGVALQAALWGAVVVCLAPPVWASLREKGAPGESALVAFGLVVMHLVASMVAHVLWSPAAMLPVTAAVTLALTARTTARVDDQPAGEMP